MKVQIVVYRVVKSGVQIVANTADIIDKDKDIYIYLFNIYKKQIEENSNMIQSIQECQQEENYKKMSEESQQKLITELMKIF